MRAELERRAEPSEDGDAGPQGHGSSRPGSGGCLGRAFRVRRPARCHNPNMKGTTLLKTIKQRLGRDDEQGFTLIELMVVVLIIAILLAIAIPTFLGARNNANSNAAKADVRNAITAEQAYWTNNQAFGTD